MTRHVDHFLATWSSNRGLMNALAAFILSFASISHAQYSTYFSLAPAPMIYFSPRLQSVLIFDANHDGRKDLFVLTSGYPYERFFVCYQRENGEVNDCVAYDTLRYGHDLDTIDVNWDGNMDVVMTDAYGTGIRFYVYKQDSGMVEYLRIPDSWGAPAIAVGDYNNDSLPDVAAVQFYNGAPDSFKVYYQGPKSVFDSVRWYPMQKHAYDGSWTSAYAADLNGDGLTDLGISGGPPEAVLSTYLQQPDGSLGLGQHLPFDYPVRMFLPEDANDDGRTDLIMASGWNIPRSRIAIFYQSDSGTFSSEPELLEAYQTPKVLRTGDMDGDGRLELLVAHGGWSSLAIYPKRQGGGYEPYHLLEFFPNVSSMNEMSVGDLNGDGLGDITAVDWGGALGYLINTTPRASTYTPPKPTAIPAVTTLHANYPNPFNAYTRISFSVPSKSEVTLFVMNQLGQEVRRISERSYPPGTHQLPLDATGLTSGVYYAVLIAGERRFVRPIVLLK